MRVFVTGTGRCGTCTFFQACQHLTNFTAGHESEAGRAPSYRFPDQHIEISGQLVIAIPRLRSLYPDARFVHLTRERESCVRSIAHQTPDFIEAWSFQWYQSRHPFEVSMSAWSYYDRCNELIAALAPEAMRIDIETAAMQWPDFCSWIGAEGDIGASQAEFSRAYNSGAARGRDEFIEMTK